nr:lipoprotein-releasing system transmembrane protein LolC-like [Nerophis lumbriciformis]
MKTASRSGRLSWQHRLPLPATLALRYLRSARRDAYVSFLGLLAFGGVALGVAAMVLVLAALSGLQSFLRQDVMARTPHLEIELAAPDGETPNASTTLLAELGAVDGVVEVHRLLRGRGWVMADGQPQAVQLIGFEGNLPQFFADATGRAEGLYLSDRLAAVWGLSPGDPVQVVSPRPTLTPLGPQPRIHRLRLAGTFAAGQTEDHEQRLALPIETARRLLGDTGERLEVRAAGFDEALALAGPLRQRLPAGSRLRTWSELNRPLFFALRLEKSLMFVSLFLIVPVAGMALVTVLALLISSKRSEIGMLQAMGFGRRRVRRVFLLLGSGLALGGMLSGALLGIVGAKLLDRFQVLSPPGDVYYLQHIPFHIEAGDLLAVALATSLLTLSSTLWAARRAAALRPVEALRR